MATTDQRAHMQAIGYWLINEAQQIGYPDPDVRSGPNGKMATYKLYEQTLATLFDDNGQMGQGGQAIILDCSEMYTMCCRMAGLQDPNYEIGSSSAYDGYGDTDTMYANPSTPHFTAAIDAHIGSPAIFSVGDVTKHVAWVLKQGKDPVMFNHGDASGPHEILLSVLTASFGAGVEVTFLNIGAL